MTATERPTVPATAWGHADVRDALRRRDVGALFRVLKHQTGLTQGGLAQATGMTQGRISEYVAGHRTVTQLEVFERIADGLAMTDAARMQLGLAPRGPADPTHLRPGGWVEVAAVYGSQQAAAPDIRAAVRRAREIDILAVRGLGLVALNDSLLRPAFGRSGPQRIRALLIDPASNAASRRATEIGESEAVFRSGVELAIASLRELAAHTDVTVEVHVYDMLPTWRVVALDDTMFVSAFGPETEGHLSPMYRVDATAHGGALHRGFRRFIDELRRSSTQVV